MSTVRLASIEATTPPTAVPAAARTVTTRIELPVRTIALVLLVGGLVWLVGNLQKELLLIFIAGLLAVASEPWLARLEARGWSRGRALGAVLGGTVAVIALLAVLAGPLVVDQGARLADDAPGYAADMEALVDDVPVVGGWAAGYLDGDVGDPDAVVAWALSFGGGLTTFAVDVLIVATLAVYLLLDGPRLFDRLTARLAPARRARAARIRREIGQGVGGYVVGQAITSLLFGIFTFATLTIAGVPEPLLLAVLAALLDVVPIVGATLATIPAVLLALTVSVPTAVVVLVLFVVYQQIENDVVVPRVYRGTLHVSSLAVLIAVLIGSGLLGIVGALLALPIAAAISAIARVWHEERPVAPAATPIDAAQEAVGR